MRNILAEVSCIKLVDSFVYVNGYGYLFCTLMNLKNLLLNP